MTEFLRTCVSDSEDETILKTTRILMKNNTTLDITIPVTVASVNFKKSFIVLLFLGMLTFQANKDK
ncbi:hypothetical protein BACSTE_02921 [Bacteroides stercoris ATCC 43183]|uniref:Uncharacterized protein n=1 Tax=Bacteroides stercoris ATCC 43183 TaxID=449673 RepID=B0NTT6_BACSE|nr:hypothetical protein BACSTE_02921 [Bacteroides stercoris ATCC 43183]